MKKTELEATREALHRQRRELLGEIERTEKDLLALGAERESELEERAADERVARVLAKMDDRGQREIDEIDAALRRIEEGRYGICTSCDSRISSARLQALRATELCIRCAREREHGGRDIA